MLKALGRGRVGGIALGALTMLALAAAIIAMKREDKQASLHNVPSTPPAAFTRRLLGVHVRDNSEQTVHRHHLYAVPPLRSGDRRPIHW
ncbi:hypothetical protein ACFY05_00995 [Microtetraspora fusca]|uniref:Uncharacterized protein n=1 Tax=Microtetraspora fusca TaxID=1997 RepID=A0ABW6UWM7_MICFU